MQFTSYVLQLYYITNHAAAVCANCMHITFFIKACCSSTCSSFKSRLGLWSHPASTRPPFTVCNFRQLIFCMQAACFDAACMHYYSVFCSSKNFFFYFDRPPCGDFFADEQNNPTRLHAHAAAEQKAQKY